MASGASTSLFFASTRVITKGLSLIGDPIGILETTDDLNRFSAKMRGKPVQKSISGMLLSSDFAVCSEVLKSPNWRTQLESNTFFEKLYLGFTPDSDKIDPFLDSIISKDGIEHSRIRKLIQPAFTHRVMQSWKDSAEKITKELLDQIDGKSEIEFVSAIANPLPLAMICEILGVPLSDRDRFTAWGNTLAITGLDLPQSTKELKDYDAASAELFAYITELLETRRSNPADDLLSVLAHAKSEGETLTEREIIATAVFLLIAGFETTVNLLSVGTLSLLENRDELRKVSEDHSLIPNLVEEALRYVSPVQFTSRTSDIELELSDGTKVRKGQSIVLMLSGANRDPSIFPDPDSFDVNRENARRNIAFGYGAHHCIGAQLARLEAEIVWRELLKRYPAIEDWEQNGQAIRRRGKTLKGLEKLPMRLTKSGFGG